MQYSRSVRIRNVVLDGLPSVSLGLLVIPSNHSELGVRYKFLPSIITQNELQETQKILTIIRLFNTILTILMRIILFRFRLFFFSFLLQEDCLFLFPAYQFCMKLSGIFSSMFRCGSL